MLYDFSVCTFCLSVWFVVQVVVLVLQFSCFYNYLRILIFLMLSLRQGSSSGEGRVGVDGYTFYSCSRRRISLHGVVRDMNSKCFLNVYITRVRMFGCVVFAMHASSVAFWLVFWLLKPIDSPSQSETPVRNSVPGFNRTCLRHRPLHKEAFSVCLHQVY